MYSNRQLTIHSGRCAAILAVVLLCAACAGPAVVEAPTPGPTSSPLPAPPNVTPSIQAEEPEPTRTVAPTATGTSTVLSTATPPAAETAIAMSAGEPAACGEAHAARPEESTDLNSSGRAIAPPLSSFNQYRLDLVLDDESATVTGTQTLDFTNRTGTPLPDLLFHLYPNLPDFRGRLDVSCAAIDGEPVEALFEDNNYLLLLRFGSPLAPGKSARVTLHFHAATPRDAGETNYGPFNIKDGLWALASFYPTLAIRLADGWDTLRRPNESTDYVNSDMALYHARVELPAGRKLLATGGVATNCAAGECMATVAAGPQRDFTMGLVQGWEEVRRPVKDTVVISSFPPDWRLAGEQVADLAADAIARYDAAFGPYPYSELDVLPVTAAGFAGVEYPGLIMIGESFYADAQNPRIDAQDVVVHEVAHQWWYNVVGNDVLREPWLDEGLTSYSGEYLYTEWTGQGAKPVTERRQASLDRLGLGSTPIDTDPGAYPDARSYVAVVYGRAPLFFDALRRELGDDTFFKLLREHYRRNAFGRATTAGFEALAEEVAGRQLDPFLAQWMRPGPG